MIGDLRNGRTVHSLSRLLSLFDDVTINYVAPNALRMPAEYVKEYDENTSMIQNEMTDYKEALKNTDVVYMTRVQKERFDNLEEYEACKGMYVLTPEDLVDANPIWRSCTRCRESTRLMCVWMTTRELRTFDKR